MYHYVRDGARVHARTTAELEAQLDHVAARYEVVGLAAVRGGDWPRNACLLTFDDGLREHLETVAPALERRGLTGCFCPPAAPVLERRVLDVQKSQFVLAASRDHRALGERVLELARPYGLAGDEELRARNTPPHRFDPPETVFAKRMLQDGLPEMSRRAILDHLFAELVSEDERSFADELYLTLDEIRELAARGHELAGHGVEHRRLGLLDEDGQRREIEGTTTFLASVLGSEPRAWAMCYAYGSRDETTLRLLREAGCALAFTTDTALASEDGDPLQLPRIDTNDLPVEVVEGARVDRPVAEAP